MTPVLITSRNLLAPLKAMVAEILKYPDLYTPVIVDNQSDYPPMLDWYATRPCQIVFNHENGGPRAAWAAKACDKLIHAGPFVVTDPDLDLAGCDLREFHRHALHLLESDTSLIKAGLALRIDDLPENDLTRDVIAHESKFWTNRRDYDGCEVYDAAVDTTWAMYRKGSGWGGYDPAVRICPPCSHLPWYVDPWNLSEECAYAFRTNQPGFTTWSQIIHQLSLTTRQ